MARALDPSLLIERTQTKLLRPLWASLRKAGWVGLWLSLLVVFTIWKLPSLKLDTVLEGQIKQIVQSAGFQYRAESASLSILFGPAIHFKQLQLTSQSTQTTLTFDRASVSISLLKLLTGTIGATVKLERGKGSALLGINLKADSLLSTIQSGKPLGFTSYAFDFEIERFEIADLGLLDMFLRIKGSGQVDGKGWFKKTGQGELRDFKPDEGDLKLGVSNVILAEQNIILFHLPELRVSRMDLEGLIRSSKLSLKTLKVGRAGSQDDVVITGNNGEITFGPSLETSQIQIRLEMGFSEKLKKAIPLLETYLEPGRQPSGNYAYQFSGLLMSPQMSPAK